MKSQPPFPDNSTAERARANMRYWREQSQRSLRTAERLWRISAACFGVAILSQIIGWTF